MAVTPVPGAEVLTAAQLTDTMSVPVLAGPLSSIAPLAALRAFVNVGGIQMAKYTTAALEAAAIPVANFAGAGVVMFINTGTTPGNLPTPSAADIIATLAAALDTTVPVGFTYMLAIRNGSGGANTATITAGSDVTLSGTMTIAQNVTRFFAVTVTSATAVTVQSVALSAAAA